jgi:hypothetical protein
MDVSAEEEEMIFEGEDEEEGGMVFEGESAEPDTKKLKVIVDELSFSIFKDEYATLFINKILKFLTIYELQKVYKMLSKDMKTWWDIHDVWRQLCIINMKEHFKPILDTLSVYILYDVKKRREISCNYKWLLIIWEIYSALTKPNNNLREINIRCKASSDFIPGPGYVPFILNIYFGEGIICIENFYAQNKSKFLYFIGAAHVKYNHLRLDGTKAIVIGEHGFFSLMYFLLNAGYYLQRTDHKKLGANLNYPSIRHNIN